MSDSIYINLAKGFKSNFMVLSQQLESRLRGAVREEPLVGEDDYFDALGAADGADVTTRHGDTQYASVPHSRRKCSAIPWVWAELIDQADKVRMLGDPTSGYLKLAAASAGRRIDRHIISAAFGTALTGKAGATSTVFDATNNNVAHNFATTTTMTIAKLIEAKRILHGLWDVDPNIPLHFACTWKQISDMLNITQVTSADYNSVKALVRGEIDTFMGFKFHITNLIEKDTSNYRQCIAWAQDGILLGVSQDVQVKISDMPQKNHSTQIWMKMDMGAVRMEEAKVVRVLCTE